MGAKYNLQLQPVWVLAWDIIYLLCLHLEIWYMGTCPGYYGVQNDSDYN